MEPITIRWETGYMTINPDAFFPTSTARIRKLLRVVALDFEHQDVIRMQLAGACESRAQEILDGRKGPRQRGSKPPPKGSGPGAADRDGQAPDHHPPGLHQRAAKEGPPAGIP